MELSVKQFGSHIGKSNIDFKENIMKQVQTIKLKDTDVLSKKVEELKIQEGQELVHLNKEYMELEKKTKKLDKKVSTNKYI